MILRFDDAGTTLLDEQPLPGVLIDLELTNAVRQKAVARGGLNGSARVLQGWEDITVRVRLLLLPARGEDYPSADLATLRAAFRAADGKGKPITHRIAHPVVDAMGTQAVLFSELRIVDRAGDSSVVVELEFVEYTPPPPAFGRSKKSIATTLAAGLQSAAYQAHLAGVAINNNGVEFANAVDSARGWLSQNGNVQSTVTEWVSAATSGTLSPTQKLYPTPGDSLESDGDVP